MKTGFSKPKPTAPVTVPWTQRDTVSTVVIGILAVFTRFVGLTSARSNGTPVFDEKHYVPQAWDIARSWFNPVLGGIESNPGYGLVVHPPLAKRLEALGEMIFGYTPLGWRFVAALFSSAVVVFTMLLARRLSQSWLIAAFAGTIALCDGVLLVIGRFGMLDVFILLFVVMATWTLAGDMREVHQRFHDAYEEGIVNPRLGFRWWRFATGVLLGLALSVKWSGLYYIAFFGLLSSFYDLWLRHRYGVKNPVRETLLKDVPSALASIVLIPAVLYVWSWRAWFASETAVYRHALSDGTIADSDWSWLSKLPEAAAGWFYYHFSVLRFHSELTSSSGHSHPWDSKPWSWLVASRPILYYSSTSSDDSRRMIYLFGTPAIWWLTVPILLWAAWAWITRKDRRVIIPLVAFSAGFLPWLAAFDRQMYFFYAAPLVPFTIVLIALALGELSKRGKQLNWVSRYIGPITSGRLAVVVYLATVIGMFLYFSPILYGYRIPNGIYEQLMWLPSWK
ncbi:dolichyl-phosphate-mannose--protein mannosyltransferase [uncultured Corynebacterium sp.]|uniref:dolichyl-phosphate-mannose--protein mannosyltransferase n=1 Tax=uncultured Corynebacterium sp. TaxID=159447 RepID=UPI0025E4D339|nr:phospholipid carrier-dependent glycosyltransferase [uncultured Corynebacterium sp.]